MEDCDSQVCPLKESGGGQMTVGISLAAGQPAPGRKEHYLTMPLQSYLPPEYQASASLQRPRVPAELLQPGPQERRG